MKKEILSYYNDELSYLRETAALFAKQHPNIAPNLKVNKHQIDDPLVGRLLESIAFLTARLNHKLDDHAHELSDALLEIAQPLLARPLPSMAMLQLAPSKQVDQAQVINKGTPLNVGLGTDQYGFQTAYETTIYPLAISNTQYRILNSGEIQSELQIDLATLKADLNLADIGVDDLRCYLNLAKPYVFDLHQLIFHHLDHMVIEAGEQRITLPAEQVKPVGFSSDQMLLPVSQNLPLGYQLLIEYAAYMDKHLYFNLEQLTDALSELETNQCTIKLKFKARHDELTHVVKQDSVALHVTPIINLFKSPCEPLQIFPNKPQRVIAANQVNAERLEIYQIVDVNLYDTEQMQEYPLKPFYATTYADNPSKGIYWYSEKQASWQLGDRNLPGNEYCLGVADHHHLLNANSPYMVQAQAWCTNRDACEKLAYQDEQLSFSFVNSSNEIVGGFHLLQSPTAVVRSHLDRDTQWQCVNYLQSNYSFHPMFNQLDSFKQLIELYNFADNKFVGEYLKSLQGIRSDKIADRLFINKQVAILNGYETKLTYRNQDFSDNGLLLFSQVISEFLAAFTNINTFTRLKVEDQQHEPYAQWQTITGEVQAL